VLRGAYIALPESAPLHTVLLATGSELHLALLAARQLGAGVRVVSVPCFERFNRQEAGYREKVLPTACRRRVAIEAGVTASWAQYVGLDGRALGIDRFGLSAPGGIAMKELGLTVDAIVTAARAL
jgi:transketolase